MLYYFCSSYSCLLGLYFDIMELGRVCLLILEINNLLYILWVSSGYIRDFFWVEQLFI